MQRAEEGLRTPTFCANRRAVVTRLLEADGSAACRATTAGSDGARRRRRSAGWYISRVVYQVVGFFDVAARFRAGDGPIAALAGGSSCSIGCALQHCTLYVE